MQHVVANDAATLVYLANQGVITLDAWLSCCDRLDRPDRLVVDLDPSVEDHAAMRRAAIAVADLFEELGLRPWAMTSGSRGFHIALSLTRRADFATMRAFARDFATLAERRYRELFTTEQRKANREGKILLDVGRNDFGTTSVAPYSVRARPNAPVATASSSASCLTAPPCRAAGRSRRFAAATTTATRGATSASTPSRRGGTGQAGRRAERNLTCGYLLRGRAACDRPTRRRQRRRDRARRAPHDTGRAFVGPRVRVRGHRGLVADVARPHVGVVRALDAGARARLVGLVGVRVGGQRPERHVGHGPRRPADLHRGDLHHGALGPRAFGSDGTVFAVSYAIVRFLQPGAVRRRVAQGQRLVVGDRGLCCDRRDRDGAADRRIVAHGGTRIALWASPSRSTTPARRG